MYMYTACKYSLAMPSLHCASVLLYRGKVMIKKDTLLD